MDNKKISEIEKLKQENEKLQKEIENQNKKSKSKETPKISKKTIINLIRISFLIIIVISSVFLIKYILFNNLSIEEKLAKKGYKVYSHFYADYRDDKGNCYNYNSLKQVKCNRAPKIIASNNEYLSADYHTLIIFDKNNKKILQFNYFENETFRLNFDENRNDIFNIENKNKYNEMIKKLNITEKELNDFLLEKNKYFIREAKKFNNKITNKKEEIYNELKEELEKSNYTIESKSNTFFMISNDTYELSVVWYTNKSIHFSHSDEERISIIDYLKKYKQLGGYYSDIIIGHAMSSDYISTECLTIYESKSDVSSKLKSCSGSKQTKLDELYSSYKLFLEETLTLDELIFMVRY